MNILAVIFLIISTVFMLVGFYMNRRCFKWRECYYQQKKVVKIQRETIENQNKTIESLKKIVFYVANNNCNGKEEKNNSSLDKS